MLYFQNKYIRFLSRPWIWPGYILWRMSRPVPPGLCIINWVTQRILGLNKQCHWPVNFTSRVLGSITIGKDVWVSFAVSGGCYIQGGNGIEIGDETIFGPGVKIISANHSFKNLKKWEPGPPIKIGKRCWISANAVILPGVTIGDEVVVGAGAVVTQSFPDGAILAGVPAKLISFKPGFEPEG